MGRKAKKLPSDFKVVCDKYSKGEYTFKQLMSLTNINKSTLCRLLAKYGYAKRSKIVYAYKAFYDKEISSQDVSRLLECSSLIWYPRYKNWVRRKYKK